MYPWNSPTPPTAISPQLLLPANPQASSYAIGTQTGIPMEETSTQIQQTGPQVTLPASAAQHPAMDAAMATSPLATSPTTITRPALPMPAHGKRQQEEPTGEAEAKHSRTAQSSTAASRGQQEKQPKTSMRIQAVTFTTKKGDKITTASCEDEQEAEIERMLQEPFVYDNEGRDPKKVQQGMKKEAQSMKRQEVFTEVNYNDVPDEHKSKIIESKWVNKPKQDEVRCRIVAIPGNNSGPRQYLHKHTHLWDSTNPAHNGTAQPLDNPSRRRVNSILTCTSSHRQSVHMATTRAISQRPQHNNSLEAQQSNLRIEVKSKILARQLRTSPTTTWTYTTHK